MMSGVCGMKAEACEMKRPGKDAPIGVFDSGVGGISVLRKMISLMPNENYIYYGDSIWREARSAALWKMKSPAVWCGIPAESSWKKRFFL